MEIQVRKIENGWIIVGPFHEQEHYCKTPEEVVTKLKRIVVDWSPVDYGEKWNKKEAQNARTKAAD